MGKVNILDYKRIYLETAREYIQSLSKCCIELENDPLDKNAVINLHISSHSLRSQSQVMGYNNMSNITGLIEKIARDMLEGKQKVTLEFCSVLKESVEALSSCLSAIEKENKENDMESIATRLRMLK
ncbi:MAG: Hpt domain-containing protein [Patescibacteria group bacterium]